MIRNVVFDIGWVFVHLDHQPFLDFLSAHGAHAPDLESVLAGIALNDHECGRMDGRGLLERCAALARRPMDLEAAHARDRKSTRLNSSHTMQSRMPSSA